LGRRSHIDDPFNDPTHIISILDDTMKLKGIVPGVASDGGTILVSCIFGKVIETDSILT
jgi:hypothetical protein